MEVSSVMKKEVVSISEKATLDDAIQLLAARRVGLLPVVDEEHHLVGLASWVDVGVAFLENWSQPAADTAQI